MTVKCVICERAVDIKHCWIDDVGWLCKRHGLELRKTRLLATMEPEKQKRTKK